jgi:hypothetical protein
MVRCAAQRVRRAWMIGVVVVVGRAARSGRVICPESEALDV